MTIALLLLLLLLLFSSFHPLFRGKTPVILKQICPRCKLTQPREVFNHGYSVLNVSVGVCLGVSVVGLGAMMLSGLLVARLFYFGLSFEVSEECGA